MARRLDIIAVDDGNGECLLSSLQAQAGVDPEEVRVIVLNKMNTLAYGEYPFEVRTQCMIDKSATRAEMLDLGLKLSDAELVMFCGLDDYFYTASSLAALMAAMRADVVYATSNWYEEREIGAYQEYEMMSMSSLNAKIYRRAWLEQEGISFRRDLRVGEGMYFATLAAAIAPHVDVARVNEFTFVRRSRIRAVMEWKVGDCEIVDSKLSFREILMIEDMLLGEFVRRNRPGAVAATVYLMVALAYVAFNNPGATTTGDERLYAMFIRRYGEVIDQLKEDAVEKMARGYAAGLGRILPDMNIIEWTKMFGKVHGYDYRQQG